MSLGSHQINRIDPETLKNKIDDNEELLIVDVRSEEDHDEWSIDVGNGKVINQPYPEIANGLPSDLKKEIVKDGREVIVTCAKGGTSKRVTSMIDKKYDVNVKDLQGGMNGWATIYQKESYDLENGELIQYRRPSSGCLTHLVKSDSEAAVIDPLRSFKEKYVEDSEKLKYAVDTHIHADHISGVRKLGEREETTPIIPEAAREREVSYIDDVDTLEDGETIEVGDIEIKAIHTPGHTTGMTSYLIDGEVLATGDGLFVESVARPDLEKGDEGAEEQAGQLYDTLHQKVLSLDDDVLVAPGHFSGSAEKKDGLYMRKIGGLEDEMEALSYDREEFIEFILSDMPPRPANYTDIISTNLGSQTATDEEAFEMELGPNNCAATQESMT